MKNAQTKYRFYKQKLETASDGITKVVAMQQVAVMTKVETLPEVLRTYVGDHPSGNENAVKVLAETLNVPIHQVRHV